MQKFNSFESLNAIKPGLENESNSNDSSDSEGIDISANEKDLKPINNLENESGLTIGSIVESIDTDGSISCWKNEKGDFYARISDKYTMDRKWVAVSNSGYGGKGMIVFLDKEAKRGNKIEITEIGRNFAKGKII